MKIMSDSQLQYKSNQNQFQNEYDGRNDMIVSRIIAYFSKRNDRYCMASDKERRYKRILHEPQVFTSFSP